MPLDTYPIGTEYCMPGTAANGANSEIVRSPALCDVKTMPILSAGEDYLKSCPVERCSGISTATMLRAPVPRLEPTAGIGTCAGKRVHCAYISHQHTLRLRQPGWIGGNSFRLIILD